MGMNLSEILNRLNKIKRLDKSEYTKNLFQYQYEINSLVEDLLLVNRHELKLAEKNLTEALKNYLNVVDKIEVKLFRLLMDNQKDFLIKSERIWQTNSEHMTFAEHLEWEKLWPPTEKELFNFLECCKGYINWQAAGLIFGAKNSSIINLANGNQPIYIVERYKEYFQIQKDKFNSTFAKKLNCYHVDEIKKLPNNSINLMVIFNEFTFMPWSMIQNYLHVLIPKLMPSGVIIFNYNNCNTVRGFQMFENESMTYTTSNMFESFFAGHKMTCIKDYSSTVESFNYLIFQKTGKPNLIKKYPSVGYVMTHNEYNDTELHLKKLEHIYSLIKNKS